VLSVGAHPIALAQPPRRDALEGVHQPGDRNVRRVGDEQLHVIVLPAHLDQLGAEVGTYAGEHLAQGVQMLAGQYPTTPRRYLVTKTICTLSAETTCLPRR
jgi:hypothetical protein